MIPHFVRLFYLFYFSFKSVFPPGGETSGQTCLVHLNALAVVEQHVAELLGHHVQVSLLALVGPGEHVEFGEVGGHVVERSAQSREGEDIKKKDQLAESKELSNLKCLT